MAHAIYQICLSRNPACANYDYTWFLFDQGKYRNIEEIKLAARRRFHKTAKKHWKRK